MLLFRHPKFSQLIERAPLESLLPEGSWKAVIGALLDAAERKALDASGAADLFALGEDLDEDARARLRTVAMDEELFHGDTPPEQAIRDVVGRLEKRRIDALQRELTRRMGDPEADQDAIFKQKQRLSQEGLSLMRAVRP